MKMRITGEIGPNHEVVEAIVVDGSRIDYKAACERLLEEIFRPVAAGETAADALIRIREAARREPPTS